MDHMDGMDTE